MSTLKTNTVQHLTSGFNNVVAHTDGAGTANAVHCRAWVSFNGQGSITVNSQFNVSSITDRGTGKYTVNFSNALTDQNYAMGAIAYDIVGLVATDYNAVNTSSAMSISVVDSRSASYSDYALVTVVFFR